LARSIADMIGEFGRNVQALAGERAAPRVLEGIDRITARTGAEEAARWMKEAVGRLDRLADDGTRAAVMAACGTACIRANAVFVPKAKARRKKFSAEDEFLAAEAKRPLPGTKLERNGNVLFHTYAPRAFGYPMRCYCPLLGALPEDDRMPRAYCLCSKAFLQTYWEEALGRPLKVEVLETALTGSTECRFRIELGDGPAADVRRRKR
jgi:hypothetical protein